MRQNGLVLIVDDDTAARESLVALVSSLGYATQACGSAEEFLEQLPAVDMTGSVCVILDVRLPGKSGIELQRELRADGYSLPIIMVSGHADSGSQAQAMKLGALAFLDKPFAKDELKETLRQAFAS